MDIRDYLDTARGVIALPPGHYRFDDPVTGGLSGATITSENPLLPATIEKLLIYADAVSIDNLSFADPMKTYTTAAVTVRGHDCHVTRSQIMPGYQFGIVAERKITIEACTIVGFSDDGIQFCGNGTAIRKNIIGLLATEVRSDKAHHDCAQGWAGHPDSPFRSAERFDAKHSLCDIEITGNHLIDRPGSTLQGITFFDGLADGWRVHDNVIMLYGPHPLTIMGLSRGDIYDNTFVPGQKTLLPPARRWLADAKRWESVSANSAYA